MLKRIKVLTFSTAIKHSRIRNISSTSYLGSYFKESPYTTSQYIKNHECVGIFWEVNNKLAKLAPPFDIGIKLKKVAEEFGWVKYRFAYADDEAFNLVPVEPFERRKDRKTSTKYEPFVCKCCGRRFWYKERLINHFRVIHEREHAKKLRAIESAKGRKRVLLVAKYSMKMAKFKYASGEMVNLKEGYVLADELKRAGYIVTDVSDEPYTADGALKKSMVDLMDRKRVGCLVLVSRDPDYMELLKEAKLRGFKTVVVGDYKEGVLKRIADASFSWEEIIRGKAKTDAVKAVGRWKDRDVLKQLEWKYDPRTDGKRNYIEFESGESEESDIEGFLSDKEDAFSQNDNAGAWWELKSDATTDNFSG